jgi:transcriptional regulator with XRE-family HTH domain
MAIAMSSSLHKWRAQPEIGARAGIDKSNLSRLENNVDPNPTIDTLSRYATAVGKEMLIVLADKQSA